MILRTVDTLLGLPIWLAFMVLRWALQRDLDLSDGISMKEFSHG